MNLDDFTACFEHLTGHPPFGWQTRLYARLLAGDVPPACDIPTGLGKTSVLALWLLALAEQVSLSAALTLPRRFVYIVDRRAVVDQATTEAEQLLEKLRDPAPELAPVAVALRGLAAAPAPDLPFALSTLRGQYADNRDWSHDPARPAIIVGTVDMVGSRVLFSGYGGLGRYGRSQHAALLGQDSLLVLDEAQLAPAFKATLDAVEPVILARQAELARPFAVMSLTATQPRPRDPAPAAAREPRPVLALEPAELQNEVLVRRRVQSSKALRLVPWDGSLPGKADEVLAQRMAQEALALAGADGAVVVFANTVAVLEKVREIIEKSPGLAGKEACLPFNGQMRGYERDRQFSDDPAYASKVFQVFRTSRKERADSTRDHPVFLLATSAGEVGVNFDADHAVGDFVSLERLAQRLGRVNRAGDDYTARITVFLPAKFAEGEDHLARTQELLAKLDGFVDREGNAVAETLSASPAALGKILKDPDVLAAYTPSSEPPPLDPARLDDWSLTSLNTREYARPQVSYWLRGITPDDDQAVTRLVWREELRYAATGEDARDLLETRPPLPREILQLPSYRAAKWLLGRAKKRAGSRESRLEPHAGEYAAVLAPSGQWDAWKLDVFEEREDFERLIVGATVVLPTSFGGLDENGLADESVEKHARDVLEESSGKADPTAKAYRRVLLQDLGDDGWKSFRLSTNSTLEEITSADSYAAVIRETARALSKERVVYRHLAREQEPTATSEEDEAGQPASVYHVEYFVSTRTEENAADQTDEPSLRARVVPLQAHLDEAEACAGRITERLDLPPAIRQAVVWAARWHDLGKDREHWQRAVGNRDPAKPWAKSDRSYFDRQETRGYRHEFGSLMDASALEELADQPERDLVLHLIAAHHGHGRPGFGEEAYDVPRYLHRECAAAAGEAELRFERLQRRFGWWGLAYLEALVKCADVLASEASESSLPANPVLP